MSRARRLFVLILAVTCTLPAVAAGPASAAEVLQVSESHLVDRGATALVEVTMSCETGTTFDFTVAAGLTQQQDLQTVFGYAASSHESVLCADGTLTTMLTIHAWEGVFREGDAAFLHVHASTNSFDGNGAWVIGDSVTTGMASIPQP
jgi:hypothetical protein